MMSVGCVLLSGLFTLTVFHCSSESLHVPSLHLVHTDLSVVEGQSVQRGQAEQKTPGTVKAKPLLFDQLIHLENDVIETKRKRSFPGSSVPIDRLSINTMDPKSNKQRKAVELPRRRVSAPLDRISVGRLPNRG